MGIRTPDQFLARIARHLLEGLQIGRRNIVVPSARRKHGNPVGSNAPVIFSERRAIKPETIEISMLHGRLVFVRRSGSSAWTRQHSTWIPDIVIAVAARNVGNNRLKMRRSLFGRQPLTDAE